VQICEINIFKTYTGFPLTYLFVLTNSIYVILDRVKKRKHVERKYERMNASNAMIFANITNIFYFLSFN